jgi:sugar/nucleoside kinase (ribokinase family)
MGPATEMSGGSVANTIANLANLGGRTAYIGRVADDQLGQIFIHDMRSLGVDVRLAPVRGGAPTARSYILITPDGERTMNTHLAACQELTPADIDRPTVEAAAITYLEGYLWDPPKAKEAFRVAADMAHRAGRKVAITLSDSFCVDRYRDEFLELMRSGRLDIVFANRHEVLSLYQTSDFGTAVASFERDIPLGIVTMSEEGSLAIAGSRRVRIPAAKVERIVDLTGAGDLYAAGFLFGLARGYPYETCGRLGSLAAGEVISHIGARPNVSLAQLAMQAGLAA